MKREFKTVEEITDLVRSFEDATIDRDDWKHAEHLIVALYYAAHYDLDTATAKMRAGIFNLLEKGYKVDLTNEMPYHETITVFWMRTVYAYALMHRGVPLDVLAKELVSKFDRDYPLRFYDRDVLFSDRARREFVEPNRQTNLEYSTGKSF